MLANLFIIFFGGAQTSASGSDGGGSFPDDATSANEFLIFFI